MNSKIYSLLLIAVFVLGYQSAFGQQKNILFLHFEPQHFSSSDPSGYVALFNVYYRLQCPKPSNFHGYDIRMFFDKTKISIIGGSRPILFDGTVAAGADNKFGNYDPSLGELRAEVLSSQLLDTSNKLLFQFQAISKMQPKDSALVSVTMVDLGNESGIDTVIIDNAPGRDNISWYPFAIAYEDTAIVVSPKKMDIVIASDSTTIQSDSTRAIIFSLKQLDSAAVKSGIFSAKLDTSILSVVSAEQILPQLLVTLSSTADSFSVNFSAPSYLTTSGPAWKLFLRARSRFDSVCTIFKEPKLSVSNTDNLVNLALTELNSICILGKAKQDTTSGVVSSNEPIGSFRVYYKEGNLRLQVYAIKIDLGANLRIYSQTGALIYSDFLHFTEPIRNLNFSSGSYMAEIITKYSHFQSKFIVVH